jgi:hypothetical protein
MRQANPPLTPPYKGGGFCWFVALVLAIAPGRAAGHVLDEYLQSTLVFIEPTESRLQINLTPGIDVADKVLSEIDRDVDDVISVAEAGNYLARLKSDLTARLDGRVVELRVTESRFPDVAELRTGHGVIQVEFALPATRLAGGLHQIVFENRHWPSIGAYLFNAALPGSKLVQVARQIRNQNQSLAEIEFEVRVAAASGDLDAGMLVVAGALLFVIVVGLVAGRNSA